MNKLTMEQGLEAIMAIIEGNGGVKNEAVAGLGGPLDNSTKTTKSTKSVETSTPNVTSGAKAEEVTYDGYGHVIAKNGKSVIAGPKKRRTAPKTASAVLRDLLMDATQVLFERTVAFKGKVGRNSVDGIIIRLSDADYTIKIGGHAKREFEVREASFTPSINLMTRGKAVNHSSAIAKVIIAEIENQNSGASFGGFENENPFILLSATASTIRFENQNSEYSFKITKKRARVVMD